MATRTVEFYVEHFGAHTATNAQISAGLRSALAERDERRDGDFKILESTNVSGAGTLYKVRVTVADPAPPKAEKGDSDAGAE